MPEKVSAFQLVVTGDLALLAIVHLSRAYRPSSSQPSSACRSAPPWR